MCNPDKGIIFVCGVPRSGTTLAQRLITEYFNVRTGQESSVIDGFIVPAIKRVQTDRLESRDGLGLSGYLDDFQLKKLFSTVIAYTFSELFKSLSEYYGYERYEYFLEKTPSNVLFVDEILQFIPSSKIIVVERELSDVVKSLVRARRSWGRDWVPKSTYGLFDFVKVHQEAVEKCKTIKSENIFIANYRDICEEPEDFLTKLGAFLSIQPTKPISPRVHQEMLDVKTAIPIKISGQWQLLEENRYFIKNRDKLSFMDLCEIQIILFLLKVKGTLIW